MAEGWGPTCLWKDLLNGNNFQSIELFRQRPTCNVTPAQSS